MSLDKVRQDINEIDAQIKELLNKRFDCSQRVAEIKHKENLPIFHPEREQQILDSILESGGEYAEYICEIYKSIMEQSKALQKIILENM